MFDFNYVVLENLLLYPEVADKLDRIMYIDTGYENLYIERKENHKSYDNDNYIAAVASNELYTAYKNKLNFNYPDIRYDNKDIVDISYSVTMTIEQIKKYIVLYDISGLLLVDYIINLLDKGELK